MKKIVCLLAIATALFASGCDDTYYEVYNELTGPVQSVELKKSISIVEGNSETLHASVYPSMTSNKNVTWASSDESVVTVDSNGVITGIVIGNATVTVTTVEGGFTANCEVTVTLRPVPIETLSLEASLSIGTGQQVKLAPTYSPANATDTEMTWESSDTSIAIVNADGLLTGVKVGTAIITVRSVHWDKTATCTITVFPPVPVTSVSVNPAGSVDAGETLQLTATIYPTEATNKRVSWTSSNPAVATVDSTGLVTGIATGSSVIIVSTEDGGKTATCTVTVTAHVTYDGNGHSVGTVPIDTNRYSNGQTVTVLDNTGNICKINTDGKSYRLAGWTTLPNGGTDYGATFTMGSTHVTLYAKWIEFAIGDVGPAGGRIFYIRSSYTSGDPYGDWRYMEVTPEEMLPAAKWGLDTDSIVTASDYDGSTHPGSGKSNTAAIVAKYPVGDYAANRCKNYEFGKFKDWFLPSSGEMVEIFFQKASLNLTYIGDDTISTYYWTSHQYNDTIAGWVCLKDGGMAAINKTTELGFIPVRRF